MSENRSLQSAIPDSEDRLFDCLKRPSFQEVYNLYVELLKKKGLLETEERELFFQSHHWTGSEFFETHNKQFHEQHNR